MNLCFYSSGNRIYFPFGYFSGFFIFVVIVLTIILCCTFRRISLLSFYIYIYIYIYIYRVSQEECARLQESAPYVKVYRYNPKYLYPKLNGYGDNGQRKVWSSCGSTYCTSSADAIGT